MKYYLFLRSWQINLSSHLFPFFLMRKEMEGESDEVGLYKHPHHCHDPSSARLLYRTDSGTIRTK